MKKKLGIASLFFLTLSTVGIIYLVRSIAGLLPSELDLEDEGANADGLF